MRPLKLFLFISIVFLLCNSCAIVPSSSSGIRAKTLTPNDFGLKTAKTGEERYWALYNTHTEAIKIGADVSYKDVGNIQISIPQNAKWIPLGNETDFQGITITVDNQHQDIALFSMVKRAVPIDIEQQLLDKGDFRKYDHLRNGVVLLLLRDENLWVKERKGYGYGAVREDILLLKDGIAQNKAIMPWSNSETTKPLCKYIIADKGKKIIKNLKFKRTKTSTHKTMLFTIEGQNNVLIEGVTITTPNSDDMFGDSAIGIVNCTNVTVQDVTINGTYSQINKYGYGISMLNDWNTKFFRLTADGKWGVFCSNNTNTVLLEECNLNRFDVHCYGRDITAKNCYFHDYYNQFSSVFGTISYQNCTFDKFIPYLTESSYNCYTPFSLELKNCTLIASTKYGIRALCSMGTDSGETNARKELKMISWPNILINGLKIITPDDYTEFYVFNVAREESNSKQIDNINNVKIRNLELKDGVQMKLSNREFKTVNRIKTVIKRK